MKYFVTGFLFFVLSGYAAVPHATRQDTARQDAPDTSDEEFGQKILKEADYLAYIEVDVTETNEQGEVEDSAYILSGFLFYDRASKEYFVGGAGHIKSEPDLQINKITVWFQKDWLPREADLVGYDLDHDCAIVKISDLNFSWPWKTAVLGDSSTLRVQDRVATLGAPDGVPNQVGVGRILNPSTYVFSERDKVVHVFAHNCPTQPGSSGGPVVNERGEVVGIHVMGRRNSTRRYAIPINDFKEVLEDLKNGLRRDRPSPLNARYYFDK